MSTIVSEPHPIEKGPTKIFDAKDPKESTKNGLLNGLVHNKKHKKNKSNKNVNSDMGEETSTDLNELGTTHEIIEPNHIDLEQGDVINSVSKSKKKAKKKKHKAEQLDSNENINESKIENTHGDGPQSNSFSNKLDTDCNKLEYEHETSPSCSKTSSEDSSESVSVTRDIEKLVINEDSSINITVQNDEEKQCNKKIEFVQYESELQMPMIMKIIQKDLSEPYSIYTYRYFIHNWPKLCFLAMSEGQCVGAIVCKLDLHRKVVRRGYIAMLAVDQNYRKLRIGSTLVQMAIHEMTMGDADEVVLETEVTNKPALKLYEKLGFVRDKRLFRYYLNGVDALRLKLWLR